MKRHLSDLKLLLLGMAAAAIFALAVVGAVELASGSDDNQNLPSDHANYAGGGEQHELIARD